MVKGFMMHMVKQHVDLDHFWSFWPLENVTYTKAIYKRLVMSNPDRFKPSKSLSAKLQISCSFQIRSVNIAYT